MLLRFRFSNYRSFHKEQELSLVASPLSGLPDTPIVSPAVPDGVLPVAAIYGANASGKSNVLKALSFLSRTVRDSFKSWGPDDAIPVEPFGLLGGAPQQSTFAADFIVDGQRYEYGFSVDPTAVRNEWLNAFPNGRKQLWFERNAGHPTKFGRSMVGENRTIESIVRPNSLLLSAAAQGNHAALGPIYRWFARLAGVFGEPVNGGLLRSAGFLGKNPAILASIGGLLQTADLGISGVRIRKKVVPKAGEKKFRLFATALISEIDPGATIESLEREMRDSLLEFEFLHQIGDRKAEFLESQESEGTLAFLSLIAPIMASISLGSVVTVDELDRSLHPILARLLVQVFNSPKSNPNGAQLIFNTHDTNLLSGGLLRRDQIWFTEKDRKGASHLYPLTDFKPRKGENLENGYLQGRYGAIPFLNSEAFLNAALPSGANGSKKHGKNKNR